MSARGEPGTGVLCCPEGAPHETKRADPPFNGPIVYGLGSEVFTFRNGVRLSVGLRGRCRLW